MTRFLTQFAAFFLALAAVAAGLHRAFGTQVVHPLLPQLLGFMAGLTFITYWLTARLIRASPDNFLLAYLGGTTLRLLLSVGLVLVHFFRGGAREGHGTWTFLGAFFTLYFLSTAFEIWAILTNLRPISEKQVSER